LDYIFIHEPHQTLAYFEELQEMAEMLKTEGKIRAWGIAYMQSQQYLHESYIDAFDVLQFNKPPELLEYDRLVINRGMKSNIIFSPIRGGLDSMDPNEKLKK